MEHPVVLLAEFFAHFIFCIRFADFLQRMKPTLSILIPTYQRCDYLSMLLGELEIQWESFPPGFAEVVISDNCSTDASQQIASAYANRNHSWVYNRHKTNIGAERNFLWLVEVAAGRFFWILGDDDLPRRGLLQYLVNILLDEHPSLVFLPPVGLTKVHPLSEPPLQQLDFSKYSPESLARKCHYLTFVSSWVVNKDQLKGMRQQSDSFEDYVGSNLIQLSWSLPLLASASARCLVANDICILSTMDNSGGYEVLKTFCINYVDIVRSLVGRKLPLANVLIEPYLRGILPGLIFAVRIGNFHNPGSKEKILRQSIKRLWCYPSFWFMCMPAFLLPLPLLRYVVLLGRRLKRGWSFRSA
jgi:glycosyltransferase involved in cell wall biosynthesis